MKTCVTYPWDRVAFLPSNCWFRFGLQVDAANARKAQKEMGEVTSDHTFKPKLRSELCCRFLGEVWKRDHPKMIPKRCRLKPLKKKQRIPTMMGWKIWLFWVFMLGFSGVFLGLVEFSLFLCIFCGGEVEDWMYPGFSMDFESLLLPHLQWDLYKTVWKNKKLRRRGGHYYDTMFFKIMVTSSKDC